MKYNRITSSQCTLFQDKMMLFNILCQKHQTKKLLLSSTQLYRLYSCTPCLLCTLFCCDQP